MGTSWGTLKERWNRTNPDWDREADARAGCQVPSGNPKCLEEIIMNYYSGILPIKDWTM